MNRWLDIDCPDSSGLGLDRIPLRLDVPCGLMYRTLRLGVVGVSGLLGGGRIGEGQFPPGVDL